MTIRTTTRSATMIARAIKGLEDFTTSGALKGVANPWRIESGRMGIAYANAMYSARDSIGIDYVIYSYGTPIAYRTNNGEWTIPYAEYSETTSRHQSVIRYAVSIASRAARH